MGALSKYLRSVALGDCTHALAGQVRPLAEMPALRTHDTDA
jgi:hypothetical protein